MNRKIAHNAYSDRTPAGSELGKRGKGRREMNRKIVVAIVVTMLLVGTGLVSAQLFGRRGGAGELRGIGSGTVEHSRGAEAGEAGAGEGAGEHGGGGEAGGEGAEAGAAGGEEASAAQLALTDTFDQVRAGARLVLWYDPAVNGFKGVVENTTMATLNRVRVEVHLSNGIELGPTTPVDLAPGRVVWVSLPAASQPFNSWVAHAEVGGAGAGEGAGEHGGGAGEGGGEHR